jgi:O-antigen ligase
MLKTWFGAPLALVWLWLQMKPEKEDTEKIVWAWFAAIVGVAVLSSLYVAQGLFTYDGRLSGWYQSPNYLAIFLAPGPFLVHYVYFRLPLSKKTKIYKLALLLSLILFVGLLFLTHSYATWLGIAVAGCLFLAVDTTVIAPWRKKLVGVLLLGIILGTFIFLESGNEKWQSLVSMQERSSFTSREMIWQAATKIISDHPLFGIGLGRFQEVYLSYQKYYPPYLEWAVPQPHNIVLAVWLQTGVLGLVGFALLVFQAVILLIKNKSRESVLLLGLLALYLIYGIFDTPFFKTDLAFSFWLIIGLTLALPKPELHKQ